MPNTNRKPRIDIKQMCRPGFPLRNVVDINCDLQIHEQPYFFSMFVPLTARAFQLIELEPDQLQFRHQFSHNDANEFFFHSQIVCIFFLLNYRKH